MPDTTTKVPVKKTATPKAQKPTQKAPPRKSPTRKTSRPSPPDVEQLVRDTAERVAHDMTVELGERISRLEEEVKRARKAVKKLRKK